MLEVMDVALTKGKLAALRKGFSLKRLARMVDLSEPYLANVLAGRVHPSPATLERIARALDLRPEEVQEPADEV